jgi:carbon storage regulator
MEMLALTRKVNERIVIGEGDAMITVLVIKAHGGKVRLAIDAPPEIPVHRQEVFDLIQQQKEATQ